MSYWQVSNLQRVIERTESFRDGATGQTEAALRGIEPAVARLWADCLGGWWLAGCRCRSVFLLLFSSFFSLMKSNEY